MVRSVMWDASKSCDMLGKVDWEGGNHVSGYMNISFNI